MFFISTRLQSSVHIRIPHFQRRVVSTSNAYTIYLIIDSKCYLENEVTTKLLLGNQRAFNVEVYKGVMKL